MLAYIYKKDQLKGVYDIDTIENLKKKPYDYVNEWGDDYDVIDKQLAHPIFENGKVREATRQEMILKFNDTTLLKQGEIIKQGKIIMVNSPATMIRPSWDKVKQEWVETMTSKELMLKRKDKIMKYAGLKKEIDTLKEFQDEFESDNTIEMLESEMQQLKIEINTLLKQIKQLKNK